MNVLDSVWLEQSKKDKIIKEIILTADFETAYYTVCKYITVEPSSLYTQVSFTMYQTIKPLWIWLPVDMVSQLLEMWIFVSQRYSETQI